MAALVAGPNPEEKRRRRIQRLFRRIDAKAAIRAVNDTRREEQRALDIEERGLERIRDAFEFIDDGDQA